MTTVIETRGLTKHYGAVRALQQLDLSVEQGEVFGFLGPNGAGKTTTIRLLLGFLRATAGQARVLGGDAFDEAVAIHRRIGYLPSDPVYPRGLTAREVCTHLHRLRGQVPERRIGELADELDLDLDRPVQALSRGNRQKVGIVATFAHDPEMLVLDEASSGLDPLKQAVFNRLVRDAAAEGRTVLLSSHVIAEVEQVADRVGIIRGGVLVARERVETLRARAVRRVEIRFAREVDRGPFAALDGVQSVEQRGATMTMVVAGSMDALVKQAATHEVRTFRSDEADLAEVFLSYYEDDPYGESARSEAGGGTG